VIRDTYGHKSYNLLAEDREKREAHGIRGVLPLVHIKSLLFGNTLVSMPFLNYGGLLADDERRKSCFLRRQETGAPIGGWQHGTQAHLSDFLDEWSGYDGVEGRCCTEPITHKVRMLLDLPESSAKLFESFKSKLRSQIRKPQKEGLVAHIGGAELLDDYYQVFSINMRDLGSPVHSKKLFENILREFGGSIRLGIVKYKEAATAAGLIFCFRDTVEIIWASSLKSFNNLSPNMLLYWSFLEYVTDAGYRHFDFGRSTPNEGTYRFKEQWGAKPYTLYWYEQGTQRESGKLVNVGAHRYRHKAEEYWQLMPLSIANLLGPLIRKNIPL
jgi:FemAB-related protein (PEP-CTERM system-associated)